jgi:hypothetical protein
MKLMINHMISIALIQQHHCDLLLKWPGLKSIVVASHHDKNNNKYDPFPNQSPFIKILAQIFIPN